MSCVADRSIFSFERGAEELEVEPVAVGQVAVKQAAPPALLGKKQAPAPRRVLDLESLTPETLEAFFPSERPVAA
jgi:hypothetical protein